MKKIRFLAPPVALALLLFGLCFADATETNGQQELTARASLSEIKIP
jgi:hypothetical protein